jgi:alpha-galactosidase/6-phospho-beta-glucosidase family protein
MAETEIPPDFTPGDFAHVADLMRQYANTEEPKLKAVLSNNFNVILAALDRAARAPDPSRDGVVEALRDMLANWSPTMSNYAPSRNRARAVISAIEAAK